MDASGPEEWTDPFNRVIGMSPTLQKFLIVNAVQERLLSARAIDGVRGLLLLEEPDPWGGESDDFLGNGTEVTIQALSLQLLEQSYKLASGRFDQPQLCMYALRLLVLSCEKPSSRERAFAIISNLVASDSLAAARLNLVTKAYSSSLQFSITTSLFIMHMLSDLRVFVRRKIHASAELIARHFLGQEAFGDSLDGSVEDSLELFYLIVEHFMSTSQFDKVPLLGTTISQVMDASSGRDELEMSRRRLQISLARAYQALGELDRAAGIYKDSQHTEEGTHLIRMLTEGSPFWCHKSNHFLGDIEGDSKKILGAREMQDGSVAVFVSNMGSKATQTCFFLQSPEGNLVRKDLPHDGTRWKTVQVVPNKVVDPLLVLVAPQEENEDMISGLLAMMFRSEEQPPPLIELWQFDGTNSWREIQTRGDIPDRRSLTLIGSDGKMLNKKFVLFGGMSPFAARAGGGEDHNPSAVSILCLESKEWLRVPHPYELFLAADGQGRPVGPIVRTLPAFSTMSTCRCNANGDEMIILLKKGKSLTVEKQGNELVPKYAVDFFGEARELHPDSSSVHHPCKWGLEVPTFDRSGYIADFMFAESVNIADSLLVLGGIGGTCVIERLQSPDSASSMWDWDNPIGQTTGVRSDLLDLATMEWRSLAIHNAWLLGSGISSGKLLASSQKDLCYLIAIDAGNLRFLCLHNVSSIKSCVEKAISGKKLKSKKNTLSYQLKKATQHTVQPMHSCTCCGIFEAPGVTPFKCCARCRVPFYCSRECQTRHWKKKGGNHKEACSPTAEDKGPAP
jgi:hypothetical protein